MTKSMLWAQKYSPSLADFEGDSVRKLEKALDSYTPGKAVLLVGKQGTGKTTSVHAYAKDRGLEIIEVNASDLRNADAINSRLGGAINQASLFSKGKIILVDEVDGVAGRKDRGGLQALAKLVQKSTFPVVMTANDVSDPKFKTLKKSKVIEYDALDYMSIFNVLKKICVAEAILYDESALKMLARYSGGDVRAAINDLQGFDTKISKESLQGLAQRDSTETILNALMRVFKTKKPEIALGAFDNVDEDIDKLFLWLDENIPREYKKEHDLKNALEVLAEADKYRGRIRRWQYYRFYVYIYNLLTAGIALAKQEKYSTMVQYKPTTRLLKIWIANQKNAKKRKIAEKIALKTHTSSRVAMQNFPYFSILFKKDMHGFSEQFDLEPDEVEWLKKKCAAD